MELRWHSKNSSHQYNHLHYTKSLKLFFLTLYQELKVPNPMHPFFLLNWKWPTAIFFSFARFAYLMPSTSELIRKHLN